MYTQSGTPPIDVLSDQHTCTRLPNWLILNSLINIRADVWFAPHKTFSYSEKLLRSVMARVRIMDRRK